MRNKGSMHGIWFIFFAADIVAIAAAYSLTIYLRFYSELGVELYGVLMNWMGVKEAAVQGPEMPLFYIESAARIVLILSVTVCFLYAYLNLYAGRRFLLGRPTALNIITANAVVLGLYYCYFYARTNTFHPRTVFVTVAFFNVLFCILFRTGIGRLLQVARRLFRFDECRAVLVGADDKARYLDEMVSAAHPQGVTIVERIDPGTRGDSDELMREIRQRALDCRAHMLICADRRLPVSGIMRVIQLSEELGIAVKVNSQEMNVLLTRAKQAADMIRDVPLVHFAVPAEGRVYLTIRHAVIRAMAVALFLVFLPLLLLIALLVKATSTGPVLFIQERLGVNRVPFRMFKFRTMHQLADEAQAEVEEFNESGAGLFKIRKDPRVTFVGRFLRRFSLDELPQLLNVIRGEMALVGPRPLPRRDFENYYEDWHYIRHGGLPGLTCLWQVSGRSDLDFHNMCILDVFYLRNQGPMLDLKILLKTVAAVLFAKGAY